MICKVQYCQETYWILSQFIISIPLHFKLSPLQFMNSMWFCHCLVQVRLQYSRKKRNLGRIHAGFQRRQKRFSSSIPLVKVVTSYSKGKACLWSYNHMNSEKLHNKKENMKTSVFKFLKNSYFFQMWMSFLNIIHWSAHVVRRFIVWLTILIFYRRRWADGNRIIYLVMQYLLKSLNA